MNSIFIYSPIFLKYCKICLSFINPPISIQLILSSFFLSIKLLRISFANNPDGTPRYENTMQYAILSKERNG